MDEIEQIDRFNDQLDKLVENFVKEHDVSQAALIGALVLKINQIANAETDTTSDN